MEDLVVEEAVVVAASEVVEEAAALEEAVVVIDEEAVAVAATQIAEGVTGLALIRKCTACFVNLKITIKWIIFGLM